MARIDIAIWPGSGSFFPGDTPFGLYDTDTVFQSDADKVADFAAQKLGYPITDIEMQANQFFACFVQLVTEFLFSLLLILLGCDQVLQRFFFESVYQVHQF